MVRPLILFLDRIQKEIYINEPIYSYYQQGQGQSGLPPGFPGAGKGKKDDKVRIRFLVSTAFNNP